MWATSATTPTHAVVGALGVVLAATADGQPPVELLWFGQGVTLLVALATGWFALRSKKTEVTDGRQARFEQRLDEELDDQRALTRQWQEAWDAEHRKVLRYEAYLIRHGIDPDTGRREVGDAP
ncbi:hypothetical protein KBX50_05130 [Micromonospora sp. C51]|uniref:hypothetical protein n=1 Tax=Micromonospora sp. C51 TaxID=2824879 RepID=UPI001B38C7A5|nr:hypothetical protein [Micromonospora sp. C51]MBQ1047841.1 hypothetical protein [Micromonospora sp. C51]